MSELFGVKLRNLRELAGIGQSDLARQLGIKRSHINNLEAGRRSVSLSLVVQTATLFSVSTDYLLRDSISPDGLPPRLLLGDVIPSLSVQAFGKRLRELRLERGWRQADMAQKLQLRTQAHISFLEAGQKEPSIDLMLRAADMLGVTTDALLLAKTAGDE